MLMTETPSIATNEITDKAYINQRVALDRREGLVDQLYVAKPARYVLDEG